ncbi:MAG: AAA family ATPase, partial [Chloroflexota bacterium]|nr:AAA family ATPase [Chloroflexota bacterium]
PVISFRVDGSPPKRSRRSIKPENLELDQSILSQRRDHDSYPELSHVGLIFGLTMIYRGLDPEPDAEARRSQKPDEFQGFLFEDASNLSLVLSRLLKKPAVKKEILGRLRDFYPLVEDLGLDTSGGLVQTFFHEKGLHDLIPATRLSDGTLRYLCLLAVLCDPEPLPVICIEEPELGLHPDIIPEVAKLLVEASSRSQLFVTTHSDVLIDALSDTPEAVVVCEKVDEATQLRRLDAEKLNPWLEKYRLGELWSRGEIGGNRW